MKKSKICMNCTNTIRCDKSKGENTEEKRAKYLTIKVFGWWDARWHFLLTLTTCLYFPYTTSTY